MISEDPHRRHPVIQSNKEIGMAVMKRYLGGTSDDILAETYRFIYLIEDFADLSERVAGIRRRMMERGDELYTSALTLGEILIKPLEARNEILARRYESALLQGAVIVPFDVEPARLYASIRKDRTIRPPDAISLHVRRMRASICLSPTMSG